MLILCSNGLTSDKIKTLLQQKFKELKTSANLSVDIFDIDFKELLALL